MMLVQFMDNIPHDPPSLDSRDSLHYSAAWVMQNSTTNSKVQGWGG